MENPKRLSIDCNWVAYMDVSHLILGAVQWVRLWSPFPDEDTEARGAYMSRPRSVQLHSCTARSSLVPRLTEAEVYEPPWMGGLEFVREAEFVAQTGAHQINILTNKFPKMKCCWYNTSMIIQNQGESCSPAGWVADTIWTKRDFYPQREQASFLSITECWDCVRCSPSLWG